MVPPVSSSRLALRRGLLSGAVAVALLFVAALPARLPLTVRHLGALPLLLRRMVAGMVLDAAAVALLMVPFLALLALAGPALFARLRTARWQRLWAPVVALPFGFVLVTLALLAKELKSERGAYPTMFDLAEGGGNLSFLEGALGYLRYGRIAWPLVAGLAVAGALLALAWRRRSTEVHPWRPWGAGVACGLVLAGGGLDVLSRVQGSLSNEFSVGMLGDPLTGLVESSADLLLSRGPSTPRGLVLSAELPPSLSAEGAALLGWPPERQAGAGGACFPHPHARPLDAAKEPPGKSDRGRALLSALARASSALLPADDGKVAVFLVSLEGFRADDVHALNPLAPRALTPFVTELYERSARAGAEGVLAGRRVWQAGVRTAQGLGAMTCGVGTLPYNLSFIRDLHPFPVRCASDVLGAAGFRGSFFYGSDVTFDDMHVFLREHGYGTVVSQKELPEAAPKGTWAGVTDFAVFDEAVRRVKADLDATGAPQHALVMSLSNHGPFTPPEDLPPEVVARVDGALAASVHRADADDRKRLVTTAYTDEALRRLFGALDAAGLSERALVVLLADHSTGHAYVWGPEPEGPETDAQKAQLPFAVVLPAALRARAKDPAALAGTLDEAQRLLDAASLSQNDVPALLLSLLSAHPAVVALPEDQRWHTLGGQVTSPWFSAGSADIAVLGINGISELYALDSSGARVGGYEDSVFLKTRADRYRVTPRLIPVTAALAETMRASSPCAAPPSAAVHGATR